MKDFNKIQKGKFVELTIDDWANEGKGLSRVPTEEGDKVVFVANAIPGQRVKAKVIKNRRNFAEAKLVETLEKSALEVEHDFQPTPGAPYISLPLERQREFKINSVLQLYRRIGKIEEPQQYFDEFIPSPRSVHYRNKMEYSFGAVVAEPGETKFLDGFALGFKKRGQWLAVEPLQRDSGLFDTELENAFPQIKEFFTSRGHTAWHSRLQTGFCRFLTARKSFAENQLLINLVTTSSELENFDAEAFKAMMLDILGNKLAGLVHTVNDDPGDRPETFEGRQNLLHGQDFVTENILGLDFKISMESFFQTNPASAERLYSKALDYVFEVEPGHKPYVLDLFSGTGTIAQLLAQRTTDKRIVGVEIVPGAVEDAQKNASKNGLADAIEFHVADVGKFLLAHPEYTDQIDTVVLDPPRAGITPKTLRKVMRLSATRIVYISCNPSTQARDMEALAEFGYQLRRFSLVDQFPHTAHVESVALFTKSGS